MAFWREVARLHGGRCGVDVRREDSYVMCLVLPVVP